MVIPEPYSLLLLTIIDEIWRMILDPHFPFLSQWRLVVGSRFSFSREVWWVIREGRFSFLSSCVWAVLSDQKHWDCSFQWRKSGETFLFPNSLIVHGNLRGAKLHRKSSHIEANGKNKGYEKEKITVDGSQPDLGADSETGKSNFLPFTVLGLLDEEASWVGNNRSTLVEASLIRIDYPSQLKSAPPQMNCHLGKG